jgi:transposase
MNMSTAIHFTDNQWALIKPHIPQPKRMGRPHADDRRTLEAILWIDKTGARWQDLPREYGDDSTANRRLLVWQETGVWDTIWQAADAQGLLDLTQTNLDATFAPAKAGGDGVGLTRKGKGTKIEIVSETNSLPLSGSVAAADEAETALALPTADKIRIPKRRGRPQTRPRRICGDKAYDSMPLRREFRRRGITANFPERVSAKRKRRRKGPKPTYQGNHSPWPGRRFSLDLASWGRGVNRIMVSQTFVVVLERYLLLKLKLKSLFELAFVKITPQHKVKRSQPERDQQIHQI